MPRTRGKPAKQSATKAKTKVARGRPVEKKLPPRIDATPQQMAQAMFALPADYKWHRLCSPFPQTTSGSMTKAGLGRSTNAWTAERRFTTRTPCTGMGDARLVRRPWPGS